MRFSAGVLVVFMAILPGLAKAEQQCVTRFSQLDSPFLSFKNLLGESHKVGLINKTKGSFVYVEVKEDEIFVTLYSSGLFDLFGIRQQSPLRLCAGPKGLILEAFGQKDDLRISENQVVVGDGHPKRSFTVGTMTPALLKVHPGFVP